MGHPDDGCLRADAAGNVLVQLDESDISGDLALMLAAELHANPELQIVAIDVRRTHNGLEPKHQGGQHK
jgi:hypothetical protein